jgi:carbonic anhydrase
MRESQILMLLAGICAGLVSAPAASASDEHNHAQEAAPHSAPAAVADERPIAHAPATQDSTTQSIAPDDAMRRLADGNARYVAQSQQRPHQDADRRHETYSGGQHPFAAVLSCADSRAPVELIFDAGIGDLFVVRVAGNVASVDEIGTLEYGVEHLGINMILVMGHTKCGAVTAVVDHAHVRPNVEKLVEPIVPAAEAARKIHPQLSGGNLVEQAIRINVNQSIENLIRHSDLLRQRVAAGTLKIVGVVYDLNSGELDWLEPPASAATSAAQGAERNPHSETSRSKHADAHNSHDDATALSIQPTADTAKPRKDNYVALAGLLAGSCAASCGVIYFLRPKQ